MYLETDPGPIAMKVIRVELFIHKPWMTEDSSSAESQKGITDQRCSVENQKGTIAMYFVHR